MEKGKILTLFENAYIENPTVVFGSSTFAVIEMLTKGMLPSAKMDHLWDGSPDESQRAIHFIPRKKAFENHPVYSKIEKYLGKKEMHEEGIFYAEYAEQEDFMRALCGYWPRDIGPEEIYPDHDNIFSEFFGRPISPAHYSLEDLRREGVNIEAIQDFGLENLREEHKKMRGVIVGLNSGILEKRIDNNLERDPNEVDIWMPEGLDIKYVSYVLPLGSREKIKMAEFTRALKD